MFTICQYLINKKTYYVIITNTPCRLLFNLLTWGKRLPHKSLPFQRGKLTYYSPAAGYSTHRIRHGLRRATSPSRKALSCTVVGARLDAPETKQHETQYAPCQKV